MHSIRFFLLLFSKNHAYIRTVINSFLVFLFFSVHNLHLFRLEYDLQEGKKLLHSNSFRYMVFFWLLMLLLMFSFALNSSVAFFGREKKNFTFIIQRQKKNLFPPIFVQIVRHFQHLENSIDQTNRYRSCRFCNRVRENKMVK